MVQEWYPTASSETDEEDDVKKAIILAIGGLALLAGCGKQQNSADTIHLKPQWQGAPYHIAFAAQATKPNAVGITIPAIKWTANPDALERRASLVVRFDASGATKNGPANGPVMDQMVMGPVDISGAEGALPADYMDAASKALSKLLAAYGIKGNVKVQVLLARSSISEQPDDSEIATTRLSDWLPGEFAVHPAR